VVTNEVSPINLNDNVLIVEEPVLSRGPLTAQINSQTHHCGTSLDEEVTNRHGDATSELPLRLFPALLNGEAGRAFDSKTVSLCKYQVATISPQEITNQSTSLGSGSPTG
jgi:hypothetical protein